MAMTLFQVANALKKIDGVILHASKFTVVGDAAKLLKGRTDVSPTYVELEIYDPEEKGYFHDLIDDHGFNIVRVGCVQDYHVIKLTDDVCIRNTSHAVDREFMQIKVADDYIYYNVEV